MADLAIMLANKLRGRPIYGPLTGPVPSPTLAPAPPLTEREASIEKRRMMTVLPGETQKFVEDILTWARAQGIPCILGETHRDLGDQTEKAKEGKTAIPEGKTGCTSTAGPSTSSCTSPGPNSSTQMPTKSWEPR